MAGPLPGNKPGGGGPGGGLGCQGMPRPPCCGGGLPGGGGAHCRGWNPGCGRAMGGGPGGGRGRPDQGLTGPAGPAPAGQAGPGCCRVPARAASLACFAIASRRCCCACRERSIAPTGSLPTGGSSAKGKGDVPQRRASSAQHTTPSMHDRGGRLQAAPVETAGPAAAAAPRVGCQRIHQRGDRAIASICSISSHSCLREGLEPLATSLRALLHRWRRPLQRR